MKNFLIYILLLLLLARLIGSRTRRLEGEGACADDKTWFHTYRTESFYCDAYAAGKPNYAYCNQDPDVNGRRATDACSVSCGGWPACLAALHERTYCDSTLAAGETIFDTVAQTNTSRHLIVSRENGDSIAHDGSYTPGETLTVSWSGGSDDHILETTGGHFSAKNGSLLGCDASRTTAASTMLVTPASGGLGSITLRAGWTDDGGNVYFTSEFTLAVAWCRPSVRAAPNSKLSSLCSAIVPSGSSC